MSRTILLADDSVTIQKVIELTFMEEDYEVVSASDGDEAIERLAEVEPDIVIADVHMPGASGIEVCKRSKELRPEVPVLLLVGTFEPFDQSGADDAGADANLKKPFDSQELLQLVGDLMGGSPIDKGEDSPGTEQPTGGGGELGGEGKTGGESVAAGGEDTWGFGDAAAAGAAAGETSQPPGEEMDWSDALSDLPEEEPAAEVEEPPAVASQSEEPAPAWESQSEEEAPAVAPGGPFELEPLESAGRSGEVFDLGAGETGEAAEAAEPAEPSWGFEDEEPGEEPGEELGEEPSAAAEPAAPSIVSGQEEPAEEPEPASAGFTVDEPAAEGPESAWPEPQREEAEEEEPIAAAPGEGEAEIEEPAVAAPIGDEVDTELQEPPQPPEPYQAPEPPEEPPPATAEGAGFSTEVAEPAPGSGAAYGAASVGGAGAEEPIPEGGEEEAASSAPLASAAAGGLSDQDVDRIARRVAELLGERVTREVAWEVVPDLAEVVIRERLRELEGQID